MVAAGQDTHGNVMERSVQDRLVEAAEELFCRRGYNETSVREIAAIGGCNVAAVNYYFGGKDNLYLEVWRRRLALMRQSRLASIEKVMSASPEPQLEDLLRSYAISFMEPLNGSPKSWFVNLMAREMVDPHLPRDMYLKEMVAPVVEALSKALLQLCPWLDQSNASLVIFSIVGQLLMHMVFIKEMFEQSGNSDLPKIDSDTIVNHVVAFSAAGIRGYANRTDK